MFVALFSILQRAEFRKAKILLFKCLGPYLVERKLPEKWNKMVFREQVRRNDLNDKTIFR
ncbi:hypothetical protein BpHYR1_012293 [Brachionus plicatilis]|uniref:Uncharacterized protein n=1 Tax=Brachionus plicatilis TaxID=10195 RepID=A0A3M7Q264_BRAPC|nr:hypothetical protein BpHYR1_012293 [Brachionus plicatilis]